MNSVEKNVGVGLERPVDRSRVVPFPRPRREYALRRLLAFADIVGLAAALAVAFLVLSHDLDAQGTFGWGVLTLPVWVLLFKVYGLYDRDAKRVSHSTVDEVPWLFHALVTGSLLFGLLMTVVPAMRAPVADVVTFSLASFVTLFAARAGARWTGRTFFPAERVLFIGGGAMARLLAHKIQAHPEYGLKTIGYLDGDAQDSGGMESGVRYLGRLSELQAVCEQERIDRVIVAGPTVEEAALADMIRVATGLDAKLSILPQLSDVLGPSVAIDDVEGITVLGLNPPALSPSSRALKRAMDLGIGTIALVALLPVMLVTALAVKISSPGPVLYTQVRVGRGGRRFRMFKFRTMVPDADVQAHALRKRSAHPVWLLLEDDPRVTPLGRILRRASLDELPQLWNVVTGDMSLVGPRPMPPSVDEKISGWGRRRLNLTPGITGLWQVLGRTSIPFEEMVKLDYLYVTNWSLWQDARLLIHTLPAVLRRRGAN